MIVLSFEQMLGLLLFTTLRRNLLFSSGVTEPDTVSVLRASCGHGRSSIILWAQHVMSPQWGCLYIVPFILSVFWTDHKCCIYSVGHMNDLADDMIVMRLNCRG